MCVRGGGGEEGMVAGGGGGGWMGGVRTSSLPDSDAVRAASMAVLLRRAHNTPSVDRDVERRRRAEERNESGEERREGEMKNETTQKEKKREEGADTQWSGGREIKKIKKVDDRWRDDRRMEGGEEHSGSNAIITLTSAGAGWHSNGMKESHFLGGETQTETAALPLERVRVSKRCGRTERGKEWHGFLERRSKRGRDGAGR